jgi:hypothetical protein
VRALFGIGADGVAVSSIAWQWRASGSDMEHEKLDNMDLLLVKRHE